MTRPSQTSVEKAAMEALEDALDQPSEERYDYLAKRSDLSAEVRELALDLLSADVQAIRTGGAGEILNSEEGPPPELPGYDIIRLLGRGGMGAVWLAQRNSRDFQHRVAIKVIKPGVFLDTMVERFRRERQILARLNHPNIAHLHDGGETDAGQPYIVMEYVDGSTLRDWLAEQSPDADQRLDLFVQIAEAVEFAHQNLVIHRDLTPGNVLVTHEGQAKLIDFGIARPQVEEGEISPPSRLSGLSLTPGFAAPERSQGIVSNTLTDIYSLGRILKVMMGTARDPELRAIADKAAANDPAHRYQSVGEMVEEIANFRAGLPVTTFAEGSGYRLRKFVQREKTLVGVAAAALIGLLIALGVTTWAYSRAEDSRIMAERRFDELRALAHFQLFDLYDQLDSVVGNTAARVELAGQSQGYLLELAGSRSDDPDLQMETAEGFLRLARIQGLPAFPNIGEPEMASENLGRAEEILRPLGGRGLNRAHTAIALLEAYRALVYAHAESKPPESLEAIARSYAALEKVPPSQRDWNWREARRMARMASLEWADLELATPMIVRYANLMERDLGDWPQERIGGYEYRTDQARISYYRAIAVHNRGTEEAYAEAVQQYLAADALFAALQKDYPNDPQTLYWRAWNSYYGYAAAATLEDDVTATRLLEQARASVERLLLIEENDNTLATFDERLREAQAEYYSNLGRFAESIDLMQGIIDGRARKAEARRNARSYSDLAYGRAIFGSIHRKAGNREEACDNFRQAETLMARLVQRDELAGYVEYLRPGVNANIALCDSGAAVEQLQPLSDQ
ncbi:serine/threonine-protein kinase [Aurantiacibacter zhengii]|nr:serine/threonine-protein kinase [Aurantiacibacter zhengii]